MGHVTTADQDTREDTTITAPLVAATEAAWPAIHTRYEDAPEVVAAFGSGSARNGMPLRHFALNRSACGEDTVH